MKKKKESVLISRLWSSETKAVGSSETIATIYQTTRRHIPEDRNINTYRRQDFRPEVFWYLH
jgi:hypothetical protein